MLSFGFVIVGQAPGLYAQTIRFYCVAPSATITSNFGTGSGTSTDMPNGYRSIEITAANQAVFNRIAPPQIRRTYRELQTGAAMRQLVNRVLQISGGRVNIDYFLIDDRTGITPDPNGYMGMFTTDDINGTRGVWPSAWVWNTGGGRYQGQTGLGELASAYIQRREAGGWLAWETTVIHETNHTQFVGEKTKWPSITITYGGDGSHWESELLGGRALAFEEGLGTFFGLTRNPAGAREVIRFLNRTNERYLLESWSVLAPDLYNVPHTETRTTPPTPPPTPGGEYAIRRYKWLDVPRYYLLFSESTSLAFHQLFWQHSNNDPNNALDMVFRSSQAMWENRLRRGLGGAVHRLAVQLETYASTPEGRQKESAGTLTSSMFPFALLDILTHYAMSQEDFQREYRADIGGAETRSRAYSEYFNHRDVVRKRVQRYLQQTNIDITNAVSTAHRYFQQPSTILRAGSG